jgi:predicted anti-sigma-YlaC factor YlaD
MDCDEFDHTAMNGLYVELDELTSAAVTRHTERCPRCRDAYAALRATRRGEVGALREASHAPDCRMLPPARMAEVETPWPRKLSRGLAWAGSHAMRPQSAMAAVFCLVVGSSMLFLPARPGTSGRVPVRVTEQGSPGKDSPEGATPLTTSAPPVGAAGAATMKSAGFETDGNRAGLGLVGTTSHILNEDGNVDGAAALAAAREVRRSSGCGPAIRDLDAVVARFPGTIVAAEAMWDEARCFKDLGNEQRERAAYRALLSTSFRDRAQKELDEERLARRLNAQPGPSATVGATPKPPATVLAPPPTTSSSDSRTTGAAPTASF